MAVLLVALSVFAFVGCVDVANAEEVSTYASTLGRIPIFFNGGYSMTGTDVNYTNTLADTVVSVSRTGLSFSVSFNQWQVWSGVVSDMDNTVSETSYDVKEGLKYLGSGQFSNSTTTGTAFSWYWGDVAVWCSVQGDLETYLNANPNARPTVVTLSFSKYSSKQSYTFVNGRSISYLYNCFIGVFYKFDGSQSIGFFVYTPTMITERDITTLYIGQNYGGSYDEGFASGYEQALLTVDPNSESYKSGYDVAKNEWYAKGFSKGEKESQTWFGYLAGVAQAPIEFLKESLSFELLGVSMYDFVCSILMVCALMVVVKAVSGV